MTTKRRVRMVRDEYADRPDYDAQMPVVYIEYRGGTSVAAGSAYLPDSSVLSRARLYFGRELFERWVRIFIGPCEQFSGAGDRDGYYLRIASHEWRMAMGLTDEYMASAGLTMEKLLEGPDDYQYWADGDVYGLIPEVVQTWTRQDSEGRIVETRDEWVEDVSVGSCWGFYGRKHAEEAAFSEFYGSDVEFIVVDENGDEVHREQKEEK